ncbi:MAG: hypothetical protein QW692_00830 [Nitrososphaerota archaeon]
MRSRAEQFYYLDTNYLINYLSFKHDLIAKSMSIDRNARTIANSVIKSLSRRIKIPFIVISEAAGKLMEHEINIGIIEILGDLEIAFLRRELIANFSSILRDLAEMDRRLEPMDCMIAAFSIASPECLGLLTFDSKLIENRAIKNIVEEKYPGREFLVTSDPRRS